MIRHTFALCTALALMTTGSDAQNFKRITTEKEFRAAVADKKMPYSDGWMRVKSNGKTEGNIGGQKFSAAWVWGNKMYCRNAVMGKQDLGTDCQVVAISGKQVTFTREYGKGGKGTLQLP